MLPKIDTPMYELTLPSNNQTIQYRPFLIKEEKILLMAQEGEDQDEQIRAVKQIITNCILTPVNVDKLATFDIEWLFVNIRSKSVGKILQLNYKHDCTHEPPEGQESKKVDIRLDINLDNVIIENNADHTNNILLTDKIGLIMKYPDFKLLSTISKMDNFEQVLDVVVDCIEQIYDGEDSHDVKEYSKEKVIEFLEELTNEQFEKINNFFATMPTTMTNAEVKCKNCGWSTSFQLRGITDFFV